MSRRNDLRMISDRGKPKAAICFFSPFGQFGYLANFSNHPIRVAGQRWKTVEHYFQAQKFIRQAEILRQIRFARSPAGAKAIASRYKTYRRSEWPQIREAVMYSAVHAKFSQHSRLASKLLATGDA